MIRPDGINSAGTGGQITATQLSFSRGSAAAHASASGRLHSDEGGRECVSVPRGQCYDDRLQHSRESDGTPNGTTDARPQHGGAWPSGRSPAAVAPFELDSDASSTTLEFVHHARKQSAVLNGASEPRTAPPAPQHERRGSAPLSVTKHAAAAIAHHSGFPAEASARAHGARAVPEGGGTTGNEEAARATCGEGGKRLKPRPRLVNWLLAGIRGASAVATVSPSYAREVRAHNFTECLTALPCLRVTVICANGFGSNFLQM